MPRAGEVLIAGTNDHLSMISGGSFRYTAEPADTPYRPSVDVLFSTLAAHWKKPGVAVLLTGMGRDGAKGLLSLKEQGWHTIAQDEKTSVVYGMPAAAAEKGAALRILPLHEIGASVADHLRKSVPNNGSNESSHSRAVPCTALISCGPPSRAKFSIGSLESSSAKRHHARAF